jgi:hypothetical protein
MKQRIDVQIDQKTGYSVYKINGENVIAHQELNGMHHLIIRDEPAFSTESGVEATRKLLGVLEKSGGDVHDMISRRNVPFTLPL